MAGLRGRPFGLRARIVGVVLITAVATLVDDPAHMTATVSRFPCSSSRSSAFANSGVAMWSA